MVKYNSNQLAIHNYNIQIIIAILAMCDMGCEVTQLQYDTIMYVSDRVVKQQKCCYK